MMSSKEASGGKLRGSVYSGLGFCQANYRGGHLSRGRVQARGDSDWNLNQGRRRYGHSVGTLSAGMRVCGSARKGVMG